ncbi:MAG TPA: two-component regulator propeller domain-containing protein [Pseudomonadales bacterium]|nr:two-component regulator propeller domain-containing protein [Pseudomonadales bacterium]
MPIRRTLSFFWALLWFFFTAGSAIAAAPSNFPFIVDSWSVEDGLPDNEAIAVLQAKDGYLWIGTLHGLMRFDGNQFTTFDEMNTPGLRSDRVVFLYEDDQTNLWIGTQSFGLAMIQDGKIKSFATETAGVGAVTFARHDMGGLLFCSENGIALYRNGKMDFYPNAVSPQLFFMARHLLVPSRDGGMWQLSETVQKVNNARIVKNFGPCPWGKTSIVKAACEDADGNLIVGTLGAGVFWFQPDGHYVHISTAEGLSSDAVLSLCMDDEGDLWAGTDGGGLNRIKKKLFNSSENFHPWAAQSVSEDARGGLWTAFNARCLSYGISNTVQDFSIGLLSNAWTVLVDDQQNVWGGTRNEGLFWLQTNSFVPARGALTLGLANFALFESRDGRVWAGSQNGLGCWDGQNWKLFTTNNGLSGNAVRAIAEDNASNLWVGTENSGLDYFSNGTFVSYQTSNGLPGNDISCLYLDADGVLWIGTSGHGLARFENGQWKSFSTKDGLVSDSIGYIIGDDQGYLWIGSNRGLMRIQRKSLGDGDAFFCRVFGMDDGLPTRECSSGSQPAAIRAQDGRLLFPTTKGLVSIAPSSLKPDLRPPQVLIESVFADNGPNQNSNQLNSGWSPVATVPPGGGLLEIHYTALNFSAPQAVRFKYHLEGRPAVEVGNTRVVRYTDLPPGHYRFNVTACNEDGTWNPDGAWLDIYVLPHFWQTKTFQLVVILVLLAAIIGTVRYISTQKLHRELQALKQKEVLEGERARIARDLHDQLGANLTQVALLGELAEADKNIPDEVESHAQQISQTARETTRSLDEIVWAVNPSNDTLEGLANYACKYAQEYAALAGLPCRVDFPAQLPATLIPPEVRHNAFLAFKEAVNNVIKHAHAREVWIRLRLQSGHFVLEVEDNGRGLDKEKMNRGRNGLRNMQKRLADIGGEFSISSGANGGTLVRLTVPLSGMNAKNKS